MAEPWWIDRTGYQIWPRSFQDSDGDGIGDIPGILSRLDHLAELGVGFIWLSPVNASPMKDMGYDISDYRDIAPEFGTPADFDRLVAEARARDIRIVMDLVVNHTSDAHPWFRMAQAGDPAYRDYYIWRDPAPDGGPPDGTRSYFGGSAWRRDETSGQYCLTLFTPEQPDLNWTNPAVRAEVHEIMRFWLDRGVAGFRLDVIDHIGKDIDRGVLTDGPELHAYLREMHRAALAGRDTLTVGEAWSATPDTALLYTGRDRGELDMMFQFAHITAHWDPAFGKWKPLPFDLVRLKRVLMDWQAALADDGWNAIFLSNHDLPRAVSAFGDPGAQRVASARALAVAFHLLKGTPFLYQGEEIGMTNPGFTRIGQFRDVETLNFHRECLARGMSEAEFLAGANANGRDTARTPVQWDASPNAGFTTGTPWIDLAANAGTVHAEADKADPEGVFHTCRRLIALRRAHPVIVHGRTTAHLADHPAVMAYARVLGDARLSVIANLSSAAVTVEVPDGLRAEGACLIATHGDRALAGTVTLQPWEAAAVLA